MVVLQIKRGIRTNIPLLSIGEFYYSTDTNELFIGSSLGNSTVASQSGNIDGGKADSIYGGIAIIDGGNA